MNRKILMLMAFFLVCCSFLPTSRKDTTPEEFQGMVSDLNDLSVMVAEEPLQPMEMKPEDQDTAQNDGKKSISLTDPEAGFQIDASTQEFRKAFLLFQAKHYQGSIDLFSHFLVRFPDHPLADAAWFYVAQSHFERKEYSEALNQFQKILASYEKSTHITDTLASLSVLEEKLQKKQTYRKLFTTFFPDSPAHLKLTKGAP